MVDDPRHELERLGRAAIPPIDPDFADRLESNLRFEHSQSTEPRRSWVPALLARLVVALILLGGGWATFQTVSTNDSDIPLEVVDRNSTPAPQTASSPSTADPTTPALPATATPTAPTPTTPVLPATPAAASPAPATPAPDAPAPDAPTPTTPALPATATPTAPTPTTPATGPSPTAPVDGLTPEPSVTPTAAATLPPANGSTPTQTPTAATPANTPVPTATTSPTETPDPTSTPTPAATAIPTATSTPTPTLTPTATAVTTPPFIDLGLRCTIRSADASRGVVCEWTPVDRDEITSYALLRSRNGADAEVVATLRAAAPASFADRDVQAGDELIYLVQAKVGNEIVGASVRQIVTITE